jgi:hypothetical protein
MSSAVIHFVDGAVPLRIDNLTRQDAESIDRMLQEGQAGTTRIGIGNNRTVIINRSNVTWTDILL